MAKGVSVVPFQSPFCVGALHSAGGMLGPVHFKVGAEQWVSPFAPSPRAPERGEEARALPNLFKFLASEWPCVPFGIERDILDLGGEWFEPNSPVKTMDAADPHGFSANHIWQVSSLSPQSAYGRIRYPEAHAIMSVERTVTARLDESRLDFELIINPRQDIRLPIGIHPVFALPEQSGAATLHTDTPRSRLRAWTFPARMPHACLAPHQQARPWHEIRGSDGAIVDISTLPLAARHEDMILLTGLNGALSLRLAHWRYEVSVQWDSSILPACLLWLSNGALEQAPFYGRYRAIGIEPIAAPFDLGTRTATWKGNPLARSGVATEIAFHANQPWRTQYSIACRAVA